jgi:hypothetical protein
MIGCRREMRLYTVDQNFLVSCHVSDTFPSSLTRVELTLMRILPDPRSRGLGVGRSDYPKSLVLNI